MHPNPAFRTVAHDASLALVRARGFGTLAANGPEGPLMSHVPFLLSEGGTTADLHLVRSTAIARLEAPIPATIAVMGPEGYVSPDWYELEDQVPTWNYVAVHLKGQLHRLDAEELLPMLDRLSDAFESRLAPKPVWKTSKMPREALEKMLRQIVPFRLQITAIESTWKLNQNKPEAARLAAADQMAATGGDIALALADLMREPPLPMDSPADRS